MLGLPIFLLVNRTSWSFEAIVDFLILPCDLEIGYHNWIYLMVSAMVVFVIVLLIFRNFYSKERQLLKLEITSIATYGFVILLSNILLGGSAGLVEFLDRYSTELALDLPRFDG